MRISVKKFHLFKMRKKLFLSVGWNCLLYHHHNNSQFQFKNPSKTVLVVQFVSRAAVTNIFLVSAASSLFPSPSLSQFFLAIFLSIVHCLPLLLSTHSIICSFWGSVQCSGLLSNLSQSIHLHMAPSWTRVNWIDTAKKAEKAAAAFNYLHR